eukprot:TRINITY_DN3178_c0_g1_i2.p1 TRINITY_DN3178_c0_g1~~TRINITY_DN3178_c0_g1_i2.p1  ORF type:complete len:294 (+),score=61.78 TRINITY_DN3178_c0_g1_i2:81-962(+)
MPRVLETGWLHKEGKNVRNWKRRFFALDSLSCLRYYRDEDIAKAPCGSINMAECSHVVTGTACNCVWPEEAEPRLCFGIVTPKRTYHIYGLDVHEVTDWMVAFKRAARLTAALPEGRPLTEGLTTTSREALKHQHENHARMMAMDATEEDVVQNEPSLQEAIKQAPKHEEAVVVTGHSPSRTFSISGLFGRKRTSSTTKSAGISAPTMEGVQSFQSNATQSNVDQEQATLVSTMKTVASDASNVPLFAPGQGKAYDTTDMPYEQEIEQLKDRIQTAQIQNGDEADFFSSDDES